MLSIFANELASNQRFGQDIKESNGKVALTLYNIGIVHLLNEKYDDAIQVFERALDIRERQNGDYAVSLQHLHFGILSLWYSNFFNNLPKATLAFIGLAYYAVEDFQQAKKCFKKALSSLQSLEDSVENKDVLMSEIMNNLGCIQVGSTHHCLLLH